MAHLVAFPWIDRNELKHVYEELYSNNLESQRHAVDRISIWKCRAMSRLPSAVESTAAFVSAMLDSASSGSSYCEMLKLRNTYSMALVRFVNHIMERGQQGATARPIHFIAAEFGVPEWIVELRHSATHGSLPSLSELKAATCWGLEWLREKFWEIQMSEAYGVATLRSAALEMLKESLVVYMQKKFQEVARGQKVQTSSKQILYDIEEMFLQLRGEACDVLIEDGYLVFSMEQLESIGYTPSDWLEASSKTLLLPKKILEFWSPVLRKVCKCDLLPTLVLLMSSIVTSEKSHRNTLLLSWIYSIFYLNNNSSKELGNKLAKFNEDLPYRAILEKLIHPCTSDTFLLLVNESNLTSQQKQQIKDVTSIVSTESNVFIDESHTVYSLDDIDNSCSSDTRSICWKKYSGSVQWSLVPFGALPGQYVDYKSLEINPGTSHEVTGDVDMEYEDIGQEDNESVTVCKENTANTDDFVIQWDTMTKNCITKKITIF
ncbi:Ribosomal biogenesis protein las1l [Mactra antiquata]